MAKSEVNLGSEAFDGGDLEVACQERINSV